MFLTPPETGRPHRPGISLRAVLPRASFVGGCDLWAESIDERADRCEPGGVFAALPGTRGHGRDHLTAALSRGAAGVLTDRPLPGLPVPHCVTPHARRDYGRALAALHGRPDRLVRTAGVTGTNGKTTCTWLLREIFRRVDGRGGLAGTVEVDDGRTRRPAGHTTPPAAEFWRWLADCAAHGVRRAAVEVSSHALDQDRLAGVELAAAVVTNVTRDHLDYHRTPAAYLAAKARIVELLAPHAPLVVNRDDPGSRAVAGRADRSHPRIDVSLRGPADVAASRCLARPDGTDLTIRHRGRRHRVVLPLVGAFNVTNALQAFAAAVATGVCAEQAADALARVRPVPGRLERVDRGQPFAVLVDYAHTPDAVARVIAAVRAVTTGRVHVLLGAGGDRDRGKRPGMGRAASAADRVVLTSDNPRTEDPAKILADLAAGAPPGTPLLVEPDRRAAIRAALADARPGDAVLLCGKGHEAAQEFADRAEPFDDRVEAALALASLGWHGPLALAA